MSNASTADIVQQAISDQASYLSLNFNLEDIGFPTAVSKGSKSIVWAPNGACKSTICRAAKNSLSDYDAVTCIDYEDDAGFDNDYIVKSKRNAPSRDLIISPGTNEINSLAAERHEILQLFNIKEALKSVLGITSNPVENLYFGTLINQIGGSSLRNAPDEDQAKSICTQFDNTKAELVQTKLAGIREDDRDFFLRHYVELKSSQALSGWIEGHRESIRRDILRSVAAYIHADEHKCPVCGSVHSRTIEDIVSASLSTISVLSDPLREGFYKQASPKTPAEEANVESRFDAMLALASAISEDELFSYTMRTHILNESGQQDDLQSIDAKIDSQKNRLRQIYNRISRCEQKRSSFYSAVKERREDLEALFNSKFSATVKFNDIEHQLVISLPRDMQTYSTGEKNLMVFIIRLMAYRGNTTDLLVIDDPLSSYDSANQYTVMFELVDLAADRDFKQSSIVIFTHNMKCVSIAESQRHLVFDYYVLDKVPNTVASSFAIKMGDLPLKKLANPNDAFILFSGLLNARSFVKSLRMLLEHEETPVDSTINHRLLVLEADRCRERPKSKQLSELFHYNAPCTMWYRGRKLSNENFVEYIDNFTTSSISPVSEGIARHWIDKIYCSLALRVWVEKQMFDHVDPRTQSKLKNAYRFIDKVDLVIPSGKASMLLNCPNVTREFLLSQKALMNQSEHVFSQPVPYEYCLNITTCDLCDIVNHIKSRF